nr:hypothetical protein [uncultured bacterium]
MSWSSAFSETTILASACIEHAKLLSLVGSLSSWWIQRMASGVSGLPVAPTHYLRGK